MSSSRRSFLRHSSLVLGAVVAPSLAAGLNADTAVNAGLTAVRGWARGFADSLILRGGGVAALVTGRPPASMTVLARVRDRVALMAALQKLPFKGVYAAGNELSFQQGSVNYTLLCLDSDDFAAAVGRDVRFAHEALARPAAGGPIQDPWGALRSTAAVLRPVKVSAEPTERFDAILQGLLDQGRYHLIGSPEFELLKQKSLRRQPASRADAASIVASLAATLAPLAGSLPDKSMVALVQSPLVSQALTQQLGRSGRLVAAEFQRLKSTSAAPYADPAACWMAALYGRTLLNAVARPEVADTDRSTALQTRRALTRARQLYQGSTPPA